MRHQSACHMRVHYLLAQSPQQSLVPLLQIDDPFFAHLVLVVMNDSIFEHLNLEGSPNLFKPLPEMHVLLDGQAYRMILNLMNALQLPTLSTTFTWNALVFSEANWTLISPRLY